MAKFFLNLDSESKCFAMLRIRPTTAWIRPVKKLIQIKLFNIFKVTHFLNVENVLEFSSVVRHFCWNLVVREIMGVFEIYLKFVIIKKKTKQSLYLDLSIHMFSV